MSYKDLGKMVKQFHDAMTASERKIWEAMCILSETKRTITWTDINRRAGTNYSLSEIEKIVQSINRKFSGVAAGIR